MAATSYIPAPTAKSSVFDRLYPEIAAGGFARSDIRVGFYTRVNALVRPEMIVLDFGAGRGRWTETLSGYRRSLQMLRGKCRKVIGVDVDPAVHGNPSLDEAWTVAPGGALPLADASIDLAVAFGVFEHVENPAPVAAELRRVLRPGGWLCAWTPNRWGYTGIGARLVPNAWHARLLRTLEPSETRGRKDVFPTYHRMNSRRQLRRWFPPRHFEDFSYTVSGPPIYNLGSVALARLLLAYGRAAPPLLGQFWHVFLRRRPDMVLPCRSAADEGREDDHLRPGR